MSTRAVRRLRTQPAGGSLPRSSGTTVPRLLTAEDVAALIGIKESTVRTWGACGRLPSINIGTRTRPIRRYHPVAIQEWIEAHAEGVGCK